MDFRCCITYEIVHLLYTGSFFVIISRMPGKRLPRSGPCHKSLKCNKSNNTIKFRRIKKKYTAPSKRFLTDLKKSKISKEQQNADRKKVSVQRWICNDADVVYLDPDYNCAESFPVEVKMEEECVSEAVKVEELEVEEEKTLLDGADALFNLAHSTRSNLNMSNFPWNNAVDKSSKRNTGLRKKTKKVADKIRSELLSRMKTRRIRT